MMMDLTNQQIKGLLIEALSYIQRFRNQVIVIKYGGAAMIQKDLKINFAQDIVLLQSLGVKPIIVHGGGPDVSIAMQQLGQEVHFIDGLRVTSAENLKVAEMVLSGTINKEIIAHLNTFGGKAVGVSGKDGNLIEAQKKEYTPGLDLGYVGDIVSINPHLLQVLLNEQYIPVVSPIGMSKDGITYNINADTVSSSIAVALKARKMILLTDVDGVLVGGKLQSELTVQEAKDLINRGIITGGMIPKIKASLACIQQGVYSAHILNGTDPHSVIAELFTNQGIGTKLITAP